MGVASGPRFPGIANDGLVFAIDPLNKESWAGPNSTLVKNLRGLDSSFSGSILNDTSGRLNLIGMELLVLVKPQLIHFLCGQDITVILQAIIKK